MTQVLASFFTARTAYTVAIGALFFNLFAFIFDIISSMQSQGSLAEDMIDSRQSTASSMVCESKIALKLGL